MNVLVLIEGEKLGGAEQDVLRIARELVARGHGVTIGTTGSPMQGEVRARGFELLELPASWGPRGIRAITGCCRARGIDFLSPHSLRSTWLCGLSVRIGRLGRLPIVTTIHNVVERRADRLARWILRVFPDEVVFVSRYEKQRVGFPAGRVLHTGIDVPDPDRVEPAELSRDHGLPEGARVVGYVGRLSPEKGVGDALAALTRLPPDVFLCLVGEGPEEDALRLRADELGVAERVIFTGFRRDVLRYLASFEVVVLPSRREALPVVLREAGMMGRPAVAAAVGGVEEIVVSGETGLVYPSGDVEALADGVRTLLRDRELRRRMGAAARERSVRLFGVDGWVDQTLALFGEVAERVSS